MTERAYYTTVATIFATAVIVFSMWFYIKIFRATGAAQQTFHVVCPAVSRNPMNVEGVGRAYVDGAGWGIIEQSGTRLYFWAGGCTFDR